jgi:hypothetical protein
MQLIDFHGSIRFSNVHWFNYANTPLWLVFYNSNWSTNEERQGFIESLNALVLRKPSKLFEMADGRIYIPLYIKLGAEKPAVIEDLFSQIMEVYEMLNKNTL